MTFLTARDGLKLNLQCWPASGTAHGTVQIVHGLGEHIGRYEALALRLNAAGWHVAGHDQRGHGRSEGPRGGMPGRQTLLADLSAVTDHLRRDGRHILLGHGLGGLVAARFVAEGLMHRAQRWARDVDGLVLSSPALDLGLGLGQRLALRILNPVVPALRLARGLKPAAACRDTETVRRCRDDPLVHDRVTPRLVRFIVDEGRCVRGRAARWRTPTLLMWGGADRCVAPKGSAAFAAAAPAAVVTAREFAGLFHEIFNEPERDAVVAQLLGWLGRFQRAADTARTAADIPASAAA
jgi:alpha-beta hydrolase superfamily lysophospholipase